MRPTALVAFHPRANSSSREPIPTHSCSALSSSHSKPRWCTPTFQKESRKMNRIGSAAAAAFILVATQAASAAPVYDNLPPVTLGMAYFTDPGNTQYAVDDLHVVGGGELSAFSFAYGTEFFGGSANGNAEAFLYLDDGAGSPGVFDPAGDTQLFRTTVNGLTATTGPFGRVTFQTQTINVSPGI